MIGGSKDETDSRKSTKSHELRTFVLPLRGFSWIILSFCGCLQLMRFSRNQLIGAFMLLAFIWAVILYRVIFSNA